ncbi:hypothetical protein ABLE91_05895 [Aquabacter sp. CN5-332]|uniref:hypothetical protein n=1 Tax=Aquabacter sp. CN5-332 TaxID=3156608 RepID=UPI0032B3595A
MTDRRHDALNMAGRVVAGWHLDLMVSSSIRLDRPDLTIILDPTFNSEEAEEQNAEYVAAEYYMNAGSIAEMAGEEAEAVLAGTIGADVETHYAAVARTLSDGDEEVAHDLMGTQRTTARALVQLHSVTINRLAAILMERGEIGADELEELLNSSPRPM